MTKTKAPVTLTADDWVEIAAALSSKHAAIKIGYYGRDGAADARWIKHLEAIAAAIGPDGENAAAMGVMPDTAAMRELVTARRGG